MSRATREPVLLSRLDAFTEVIGRSIAWLVLMMMLVQFAIVVMRYLFNVHSIVMQESVMYMHAAVFMLAAAFTLKHDGHVRVDVFNRRMSPRGRAWIELFGTLLLLIPVVLFLGLGSLRYVASSWAILERSSDGGLPAVFLLKTLIPLMCLLLLLQGIAQAWRQILILRGRLPAEKTHEHEEIL
ncbi:TRAP transporter small permease subunit [Halomonas salipaludis]|uniref:TRAP transporter small permease protein n=1 Tax=Halomonas salipaludis TaxID=2032625 RepID=A0A2A2EYB4_9GAMM|nr:TRAP transporter small permease subunit [Halomonas salipaludis]PAU77540.1 C4-dicarboxylate ABC transporter permease [Halomonas salipaludis]